MSKCTQCGRGDCCGGNFEQLQADNAKKLIGIRKENAALVKHNKELTEALNKLSE